MPITSNTVFTYTFLLCVASIACAIPIYGTIRKNAPHLTWNRSGRVSTDILNKTDILGLGLLILYCGFMLAAAQMPLETEADGETAKKIKITPMVLLAGWITQLVPGLMIFALLMFRNANLPRFFGLRWKHSWTLLWIAPAGVILTYAFVIGLHQLGYHTWLKDYFGDDAKVQETIRVYQETSAFTIRGMLAVSVVLIAPVVEEVVFRGYIYPAAKRFTDRSFAALFSSLLFAAVHFNINALVPLFFLALLLTLAYELTGSLWAPISIHALFNATTLVNLEMDKLSGN